MTEPALACVEVSSIARGVVLLDQMVKRAAVRLVHHGRHSNGKYIILLRGDVAEVEEAYMAALNTSSGVLIGSVFLPNAHDALLEALEGGVQAETDDALLLVEMRHVWSALEAIDMALKRVDACVSDLHLAAGIGGKGYFALQGMQFDMEAAQDEIHARFSAEIVEMHLLARPHVDMLAAVGHGKPFDSSRT
jgi:microcompartment protein CcmL/EutN